MTNAWTTFNRNTPAGTPGREPATSTRTVSHRMEVRSWMKRTAVRKRPKRETRGTTVRMSRKRARSGSARRTEPNPEKPWIRPARKATVQM